MSVPVSPRTSDDRQILQQALSDLARQDLTIKIETDPIDGQMIIAGVGELHLEMICGRILREYNVDVVVGEPKVIYLETIRTQAEAEGKYIRQTGGHGQYAHVRLRLEPGQRGSGYQFVDQIPEGAVPMEFVEPVNFGVQSAMKGGILGGHEMVDLRAVLYDGSYHLEDSNEMAFKIAASMAFKEAARRANPVILEPIMSIEVVTPEDFVGTIMGDLSFRRGQIKGMENRAGSQVIQAVVPLAEMFGYATDIRSNTRGRAEYSMHFAGYDEAPRNGEPGGDEAGVTAYKPKGPNLRRGFAAADLESE
jgi:elongation factor G